MSLTQQVTSRWSKIGKPGRKLSSNTVGATGRIFYRRAYELSFPGYVSELVVPYYSKLWNRQVTLEELNKKSSLYAIGDKLVNNDKVFVIYTTNDFLANDADRVWLAEHIAKHIVFFNSGGHIGQLFFQKVRDHIESLLQL